MLYYYIRNCTKGERWMGKTIEEILIEEKSGFGYTEQDTKKAQNEIKKHKKNAICAKWHFSCANDIFFSIFIIYAVNFIKICCGTV